MSATIETFIETWFEDGNLESSLYKSEEVYFQFLEQFNSLSDEECKKLLTIRENLKKSYFENLITTLCYFRTGKINLYKTEIINIFEFLLKAKRYPRMKQLLTTLKMCNAPLSNLKKYEDIVLIRLGDPSLSLEIDFNSITDNANIYFKNKTLRREYYKSSEVYSLTNVLSAFLAGLSEISSSDEVLDDLVEIAKHSRSFELKEIIISIYPSKADAIGELEPIQRIQSTEKIKYSKELINQIDEFYQNDKKAIVGELINAKEALYEDGIKSDLYFLLIDKISKKYKELGETEKYESLQNRLRQRKIKSHWSDLK
ncbi:hypothetical protein [Bacteriovorax sp. Seq25_V]|uniref:hypothetical protein n=1 Tax=Bacteriovorax sp. Seq25_V TaxID=1201288 RepID=UPI00038A1466|nr:hypothetical protein [Bacteriovorax sp. Seq25_V]EQC43468.1 hypothetical protein M900_0204 [Bacteriovorax sp. Seq25_V]